MVDNFTKRTNRSSSTTERLEAWTGFLEIMHEARSRHCSNSRDRIYGYRGLGEHLGRSILLLVSLNIKTTRNYYRVTNRRQAQGFNHRH
jgi:hypothetical protein